MGRKPKDGGAEGKKTDPAQSERFLEAARRAGVDETGKEFEQAFEQIIKPDRSAPTLQSGKRPKPAT